MPDQYSTYVVLKEALDAERSMRVCKQPLWALLEAAFSCRLTMVVPDLLYERELESESGPFLRKLGLGVVALTPEKSRMRSA